MAQRIFYLHELRDRLLCSMFKNIGFLVGAEKMMEAKAITVRRGFFEGVNKYMCHNCRGAMAEVDRVSENGFSFIWYQCMRANCDGQWLEKKSTKKERV